MPSTTYNVSSVSSLARQFAIEHCIRSNRATVRKNIGQIVASAAEGRFAVGPGPALRLAVPADFVTPTGGGSD